MGPTLTVIDHHNIYHNLSLIRQAIGHRKIMAVVKANAYGHGEVEVARTAIDFGCEYLGVAFIEEGLRLRNTGIDTPILVFGAHDPEYLVTGLSANLAITATSVVQLEAFNTILSGERSRLSIHLKIETGMHRVGLPIDQIETALSLISKSKHLHLQGIYSHFATSDDPDQSYAKLQLNRFLDIMPVIKDKSNTDLVFHMANSGAIMSLPESYLDLVRPGIMIYGYPPSPDFNTSWPLREALSLHSRLGLIKFVKKNEPISYGRRFYTKEDTHIGVIPAGYADGINRMNTNNAFVTIGDNTYPLVGTVCMDMVMVDLGPDLKHQVGDRVIIYGDKIPVTAVAKRLKTIPYEITCSVSSRVPRIHHSVNVEES
jgi:alanine racemase